MFIHIKFIAFTFIACLAIIYAPSVIPETVSSPFSDDTWCFQAVKNNQINLAVKFHEWLTDPLLILDLSGTITLVKRGRQNFITPVHLTFKYVNERCPSSFVYSNGMRDFDKIIFDFNLHGGYKNQYRINHYSVEVFPNVHTGWISLNGTFNWLKLWVKYVPNLPTVISSVPVATVSDVVDSVQISQYDQEKICIMDNFDIYAIVANFGGRSRVIPKYQALKIHVFSGNDPVYVRRVNAFPCPNGDELYEYNKPKIVVDSNVANPSVYMTFEELGSNGEVSSISLSQLQSTVYFETDCAIEKLSDRDEWLHLYNRLFVVESEGHYLISREGDFTRIRSLRDQKPIILFEHMEQASRSVGMSYKWSRKLSWIGQCGSVRRTEENSDVNFM